MNFDFFNLSTSNSITIGMQHIPSVELIIKKRLISGRYSERGRPWSYHARVRTKLYALRELRKAQNISIKHLPTTKGTLGFQNCILPYV